MDQPALLLTGATVATMEAGGPPYGLRPGAAIAVAGGRIAGLGTLAEMRALLPGAPERDLAGRLVTPA